MKDELAQRRRALAAKPSPDDHRLSLEIADGMVELPLPGITIQWSPDEAESFARTMLAVAKLARDKR